MLGRFTQNIVLGHFFHEQLQAAFLRRDILAVDLIDQQRLVLQHVGKRHGDAVAVGTLDGDGVDIHVNLSHLNQQGDRDAGQLVNDNARTEMDSDAYRREYDALSAQYKQATDRIQEIDEELRSREARKKQIALFLRMFEKQEADVEFDPGAFVAMVERVVVQQKMKTKCIGVKFELRNGQEWKIRFKKGDDAG